MSAPMFDHPELERLEAIERRMAVIKPRFTGMSSGILFVDGTPSKLIAAKMRIGNGLTETRQAAPEAPPNMDAVRCRICKRQGPLDEFIAVRENKIGRWGYHPACRAEIKEAA